jgi:hypothetical protein
VSPAARPAEAFEHGDPKRYRRGCRCPECKAGDAAYRARLKYLRQTGRAITRTPNRAADHITLLRAGGLDDRDIRKQADIVCDVLYRIMRREGTILASTEARILAIPVPKQAGPIRSRAYVSGLGTRRRLRALVAAGWYSAELARRMGKTRRNFGLLLEGRDTGNVAMFITDQARAVYAELHNQRPEDHGIAHYYAERARQYAAARGWAGPDYWDEDDFDNPDFVPATSDDDISKNQLGALRRAEIAHLITFNLSHADIANRLGMNENYVRDIAREIATGQRRIRPAEGPAAQPYFGAAA